jgi:hypothetical protein
VDICSKAGTRQSAKVTPFADANGATVRKKRLGDFFPMNKGVAEWSNAT